mmetsp:Transcript_104735/g.201057  ORF Transcript_104735/g.201057 Transcript_104735/m.201057 type:complete len:211 (-) Transcript_104735:467-1099(-)
MLRRVMHSGACASDSYSSHCEAGNDWSSCCCCGGSAGASSCSTPCEGSTFSNLNPKHNTTDTSSPAGGAASCILHLAPHAGARHLDKKRISNVGVLGNSNLHGSSQLLRVRHFDNFARAVLWHSDYKDRSLRRNLLLESFPSLGKRIPKSFFREKPCVFSLAFQTIWNPQLTFLQGVHIFHLHLDKVKFVHVPLDIQSHAWATLRVRLLK